MKATELTLGRSWLIRLETDQPLWSQVLEAAASLGVRAAHVNVIGAVQNAELRVLDQTTKVYADISIDKQLEMSGAIGNVTTLDGEPFLHMHVTFVDHDGVAYGGHLHETKPTRIFVGELWLQELLGDPPVRLFDERCGLALW